MVYGWWFALMLAAPLASFGCGGAKRAASGGGVSNEVPSHDDSVSGVVLHAEEHWPLAGRSVEIGGKRAVTDADGRFRIQGVAATYDVFVSEADGSWVSVYRGLSRRDPVLAQDVPIGMPPHARHTMLTVVVDTPQPLGRDTLLIQVRSRTTRAQGVWPGEEGLEHPLSVAWDGAPELHAEVVAVRRHYSGRPFAELQPGEVFAQHALARAEVTLVAGRDSRITLKPAPLPAFRVDGEWKGEQPTSAILNGDIQRDYRWVFGKYGSVLHAPLMSANRDFPYVIDGPDVQAKTLCLWLNGPKAFTQRCGVEPKQRAALGLEERPRLLTPAIVKDARNGRGMGDFPEFGQPLSDRAEFAWEATPGVNRLRVKANSPSPATPSFDVYTTASRVMASEFLRDVRLSRSEAEYAVQVTHFAPFTSVDALSAPERGIAARTPPEVRMSMSEEVPVLTVPAPPAGAVMPEVKVPPGLVSERSVPWAPCQYPANSEIACGNGSWFSLRAINNRLRHFPELAFGIDIFCVTDCAGAEAFVKAESEYAKAHPGFGASEPMDLPMPPPPPLPDMSREELRGAPPQKNKPKAPKR